MRRTLLGIYGKLYKKFGPQYWWPGDTPFEVIVGAILTQNTAWYNVEKAITNLQQKKLLSPKALSRSTDSKIAALIRPSGYYNIKTKRLRNFLTFLNSKFKGNLSKLLNERTDLLREDLLRIKGIGPETADSILLYAANKPVFVIDTYTKRILSRHGIAPKDAKYEKLQNLFMSNLTSDVKLYNEYHALIVKVGKEFCKPKPKCALCPLKNIKRKKG